VARKPMPKKNIKNEIVKELNQISDSFDLEDVNMALKSKGIDKIEISKNTLKNIGKWILDGKSELEIRNNLELTSVEWAFLLKNCPALVIVMQKSTAYADIIVGGTLLQTAIGGKVIKKKVPMKVRDYADGKVIGEHYEYVEVEEETQPNPMLLKFLAENKLSEKFGGKQVDNSKEYKNTIENMSDETLKAIEDYRNANK
jgi:hypothetical protein